MEMVELEPQVWGKLPQELLFHVFDQGDGKTKRLLSSTSLQWHKSLRLRAFEDGVVLAGDAVYLKPALRYYLVSSNKINMGDAPPSPVPRLISLVDNVRKLTIAVIQQPPKNYKKTGLASLIHHAIRMTENLNDLVLDLGGLSIQDFKRLRGGLVGQAAADNFSHLSISTLSLFNISDHQEDFIRIASVSRDPDKRLTSLSLNTHPRQHVVGSYLAVHVTKQLFPDLRELVIDYRPHFMGRPSTFFRNLSQCVPNVVRLVVTLDVPNCQKRDSPLGRIRRITEYECAIEELRRLSFLRSLVLPAMCEANTTCNESAGATRELALSRFIFDMAFERLPTLQQLLLEGPFSNFWACNRGEPLREGQLGDSYPLPDWERWNKPEAVILRSLQSHRQV